MNKLFAILLVVCGTIVASLADEAAETQTAKEILKRHQDAVIWVSAVLKTQMTGMGVQFGHGQEQKAEALGTIIDPSGLTVVSYSMLDMMSMFSDFSVSMDGEQEKIGSKSQFSDVKMRLADGTEIPAKLVLRDPDLDLAFLLPEKKEGEKLPIFSSIKLETAPKAEVLDKLITLARLGKALDCQPLVAVSRISAVVKKPRTFYVTSEMTGLGTPVFTLNGKVLGISLMRKAPKSAGMAAMMAGGISPVIIPAEDVMEIAQQALKKKDSEENPEEKEELRDKKE